MQPEPPPGTNAPDGPAPGAAPGGPVPNGPRRDGPVPNAPVRDDPVPDGPGARPGPARPGPAGPGGAAAAGPGAAGPATAPAAPGSRRARAYRMPRPPRPGLGRNPVWSALVTRAEHVEHEAAHNLPAWRRSTRGEPRWPVTISVIVAIVLQRLLPGQLALRPVPGYLVPILEGGVLLALAIANPVRIERRGPLVRWISIVLILVISVANAASAVLLIQHILTGHAGGTAGPLLASGAAIWATNVIAFALWYWEFDRGGPVHRAHATFQYLDLAVNNAASSSLSALIHAWR